MKIFIILGTRPEIVRLSCLIRLCKKYHETTLVHTGQNYDYHLNDLFFRDLDLMQPDIYLGITGEHVGDAVGKIISATYGLFSTAKPDAVIILGDTNSCLSAYSAKRLKIPVFHVEAGNRAFDANLPEEINRRIIDHISDVNMCYMEHARRNLLMENIKSQFLFVIGSPIPEVFSYLDEKIKASNIMSTLDLKPQEFFLWSVHREDNLDNPQHFQYMIDCLYHLAEKYQKKIIFGAHPRTRKKIMESKQDLPPEVYLTTPFGIVDYYHLMTQCCCVISDSGTLTEEANILHCRALLYRYSTEHPEGVDNGSIMLSNLKWEYLSIALDVALKEPLVERLCPSYVDNDFSKKVLRIITSYPPIVNRFVWMKNL